MNSLSRSRLGPLEILPLLVFWHCIYLHLQVYERLPRWLSGKKNPLTSARRCKRGGRIDPWAETIPWRRAWQPPPLFLPGESHGQRSLRGYSPWGCKETGVTECARMRVHDMFPYCLDLPLEFKLNVDRVLFTRYRAQ